MATIWKPGYGAKPEGERTAADRVRHWVATCGGLGLFPYAPGSLVSLVAGALYVCASRLARGPVLGLAVGAVGLVLAAVGIAIGRWAQGFYKERDPRQFVLDEAAGMVLVLAASTPTEARPMPWAAALAAVLLFRLFDIVKPFPAGRAERLRAGWGIVLDDLAAGAYAALCLRLGFGV